VLGAQVVVRREGAAEPAEERDEREDVVAVVVEDPRQRRGPPGAEEVEVERRNQGARHIVLALEPDDLALERRDRKSVVRERDWSSDVCSSDLSSAPRWSCAARARPNQPRSATSERTSWRLWSKTRASGAARRERRKSK